MPMMNVLCSLNDEFFEHIIMSYVVGTSDKISFGFFVIAKEHS